MNAKIHQLRAKGGEDWGGVMFYLEIDLKSFHTRLSTSIFSNGVMGGRGHPYIPHAADIVVGWRQIGKKYVPGLCGRNTREHTLTHHYLSRIVRNEKLFTLKSEHSGITVELYLYMVELMLRVLVILFFLSRAILDAQQEAQQAHTITGGVEDVSSPENNQAV